MREIEREERDRGTGKRRMKEGERERPRKRSEIHKQLIYNLKKDFVFKKWKILT